MEDLEDLIGDIVDSPRKQFLVLAKKKSIASKPQVKTSSKQRDIDDIDDLLNEFDSPVSKKKKTSKPPRQTAEELKWEVDAEAQDFNVQQSSSIGTT